MGSRVNGRRGNGAQTTPSRSFALSNTEPCRQENASPLYGGQRAAVKLTIQTKRKLLVLKNRTDVIKTSVAIHFRNSRKAEEITRITLGK